MIKYFLVFSILTIIFVTCSSQGSNIDFQLFNYSYQNRKFSVVPAYLNMKLFVEEAKKHPAKITHLYDELIYQPIFERYVARGKYPEIMKTLASPITDITALQEEIALLENSNLAPFIFEQLKTISDSLPCPDTKVVLLAMNPATKVLLNQYHLGHLYVGVTAFATGIGNIIISIDPRQENWQMVLRHTIAHEYHHNVWSLRHCERNDFSVIEYLVFEGRAEYFANHIFADATLPWAKILSPQKEKDAWSIFKNNRQLRSFDLDKFFYSEWKLPYAIAFAMGFSLVSRFMTSNPQVSLRELTDLNPMEILDRSGYQSYINNIE